jgi:RNA polymerase sigma factor (sigma-70 family)
MTNGVDEFDLVAQYLTGVGEYELLTAEGEVRLAQRMEAGKDAEGRLETEELEAAERRRLERVVADADRARNEFLTANLRLVVSNARRYLGASGLDYLDLIQEGNLGLIRAVEKFDWRKGFKFSTYATWWIRQAITRAIAQQSRTVRIPVHLHEVLGAVRGAFAGLERRHGRQPTIDEVAEETGLAPDRVEDALAVQETLSLHRPIGDDGAEFGDFIVDEDADDPFLAAHQSLVSSEIRRALASLPEREARILTLRYGLEDGRPRPLQEIAEELELTPERIRQLERAALEELRSEVPRLAQVV